MKEQKKEEMIRKRKEALLKMKEEEEMEIAIKRSLSDNTISNTTTQRDGNEYRHPQMYKYILNQILICYSL